MQREEREFTSDGDRWRACVALRGRGGHGLVYFAPLEGDDVDEDDGRDRRIPLAPGRELSDLEPGDLRAGLRDGTPLTGTERRIRAPDGRLWLVQSVGPVWADRGVAEGLTGLVFTSLEGPPERRTVAGGHAGRMSAEELSERWRAAGEADGDGAGPPGRVGDPEKGPGGRA